jgi:hypothetical protein
MKMRIRARKKNERQGLNSAPEVGWWLRRSASGKNDVVDSPQTRRRRKKKRGGIEPIEGTDSESRGGGKSGQERNRQESVYTAVNTPIDFYCYSSNNVKGREKKGVPRKELPGNRREKGAMSRVSVFNFDSHILQ